MLHFEGDTDFPQLPAVVFAKLSDAGFLVQCIPGVEEIKKSEPAASICILRPGFSFVRGTLEITMQVAESVAGSKIGAVAHARGIGSSNDVEAVLLLAPQDGGTRVHWTADVTNLGGLLRAIPQGLLRGAAQKVIADVWESIKAKLAGEPGA
jgi:carbon monoxide dehydrogenase subunit G